MDISENSLHERYKKKRGLEIFVGFSKDWLNNLTKQKDRGSHSLSQLINLLFYKLLFKYNTRLLF